MKSISLRISRAILTIAVTSIVVMVAAVLMVNEDLENTMLQVELQEQRDVFMKLGSSTDALVRESAGFSAVHIPAGAKKPDTMPAIFAGLPDNYSAEIERDGKTLLVRTESGPSGAFYIAKDISHFEARESLFQIALGVVALLLIGLSLLLAGLSSRRIIVPLQQLSDRISSTPVGQNMPHIPLDYQDSELHTIAITFNRFLDELEAFVKREQSLLNLASHELRTPIAVISGALDVLESRQQLAENDQATLARIRRACSEMGANVSMLLTLARRDSGPDTIQTIALMPTLELALDDLGASYNVASRVSISGQPHAYVQADPTMVRMLLRNLMQNALQHTAQAIQLHVQSDLISISDQGNGLSPQQQALLTGQNLQDQDVSMLSGLGLYIVTLMCERLNWRLELVHSHSGGTLIHIHTTR